MPPPATEPLSVTDEQAAAAHAATARRHAAEDEAARKIKWWHYLDQPVFGAIPAGALVAGFVHLATGGPLLPALFAMAGGVVAGVVAMGVMFIVAESVPERLMDSRPFQLFALYVVPAVVAAASTWVIAGYLR